MGPLHLDVVVEVGAEHGQAVLDTPEEAVHEAQVPVVVQQLVQALLQDGPQVLAQQLPLHTANQCLPAASRGTQDTPSFTSQCPEQATAPNAQLQTAD